MKKQKQQILPKGKENLMKMASLAHSVEHENDPKDEDKNLGKLPSNMAHG